MPFIPPNPRLDLLPPDDRQRAYREQRELLERLTAEYHIRGWAGLIVLLMIAAAVAIAYFALPIR